ncbi:hypothetical protein DPMN_022269, partial [Dreissena polymorpha]
MADPNTLDPILRRIPEIVDVSRLRSQHKLRRRVGSPNEFHLKTWGWESRSNRRKPHPSGMVNIKKINMLPGPEFKTRVTEVAYRT